MLLTNFVVWLMPLLRISRCLYPQNNELTTSCSGC